MANTVRDASNATLSRSSKIAYVLVVHRQADDSPLSSEEMRPPFLGADNATMQSKNRGFFSQSDLREIK
jgi:hypothetical protein